MKHCERCNAQTASRPDEVGKLGTGRVVGGAVTAAQGGTAQWLCVVCAAEARKPCQCEASPSCHRLNGWMICARCEGKIEKG